MSYKKHVFLITSHKKSLKKTLRRLIKNGEKMLFVLKILKFLLWHFGQVENSLN